MKEFKINVPQLGPRLTIAFSIICSTLTMCNYAYDAAMINSLYSIPSFSIYFAMTSTWSGLIVAMMGIGSIGGLPLASISLDMLGRKWGMAIGAVIQLIGALVSALAHNIAALLIGRFLIGAGLIINGTGAPAWMVEISPPSRRSLFTNLMLALMSIAGAIAAIIALAINGHDTEWVWRGPLLAFDLLVRLHARGNREDTVVYLEFEEIVAAVTYEQEHAGSWKSLVSTKSQIHRFSLAVLSNVFLQASGCSFMQYFFTLVIAQAGVTNTNTLLYLTLGLCIWQALSNQCGVLIIGKFGRKTVMLFASVVLTLCFILLTILLYKASSTGNTKYGIGGTAIIFIFQWTAASSWMLLAYSYPPEILTFAQRTRGLSISQAVGYGLVTMFSYCLPIAVTNIGYKWYAILACLNAGIFVVVYFVFVETKGKTLEEIDIIFEGAEAFNTRRMGSGIGKDPASIEHVEDTSAAVYMPSLIKSD
ncbi:hypothetical protein N7457_000532 [Penicillium paradoxum]|uniref:uncharacterized protein n=1 Tax=Penicillium paradoxum TaxID=176176 RepID=UPI0025466F3F|nr:uncharacterized protein N7457_000532 [Penicillium paradoxum]KAJ5793933.1 hypothetical protein N7457_000532 [Penicillium paradoxum]